MADHSNSQVILHDAHVRAWHEYLRDPPQAEARTERDAIRAESTGFDERVVFSWGSAKYDSYPEQVTVDNFPDFARFICDRRAKSKGAGYFCASFDRNNEGRHRRSKDGVRPRRFLPIDIDGMKSEETLLELLLALQPYRHFAYTTASHTPENPHLRVVHELSRPVDRDEGIRIGLAFQRDLLGAARLRAEDVKFDESVYRAEQPCFGLVTTSTVYPRDRRMNGSQLDVDALLAGAPELERSTTACERADEMVERNPRVRFLREQGFLLDGDVGVGKIAMKCPNSAAHSSESSPSSTVLLLPHFNGVQRAVIKCLHSHCANVDQAELWRLAGYREASGNLEKRQQGREQRPDEPIVHLPLVWARDAGPMLDTPYVIKGVIGRGDLIVVYGEAKCGKTFLVTDACLSVATGLDWFGCRVTRGFVIYVASEMGRKAQRRAYAWIAHHGIDSNSDPPFAIVPEVVNLLDELAVLRLVATIENLIARRGKPVLVAIDTLARSTVGGDENSAKDIGLAVAVGGMLRDKFDTATLFVHHVGKDPTKGPRGSYALFGAVDGQVLVTSDASGNRLAAVEWLRDGESGRQVPFRLRVVDLGTDKEGDKVTTCVVEHSDVKPAVKEKSGGTRALPRGAQLVLTAIQVATRDHGLYGNELPQGGIPREIRAVGIGHARDEHRKAYGERDPDKKRGDRARQVAFNRGLDELAERGIIVMAGPHVWQTPPK